VLKALSFMFEYIGEMAKDYIYAVTPLLVDAMMERLLYYYYLGANFLGFDIIFDLFY
jgi:splicing factor 3B subunit 1